MYNFGRKQILTSLKPDSEENVRAILERALPIFAENRADSEYLYNFYKGDQDILYREKEVRPDVNNKIVENHALEIVSFKKSYIFGDKIKYVKRGHDYIGNNTEPKDIATLNQLMEAAFKHTHDEELGEWIFATGIGYRGIFTEDSPPYFVIDTFTPLEAFVVYSNEIGKKPILCGKFIIFDGENNTQYVKLGVYTETNYHEYEYDYSDIASFPVSSNAFNQTASITNGMGRLPIIEYISGSTRQGVFEPVLTMLNAINTLASDRVNGVEQFVQAFLLFLNCDMDDDEIKKIPELGAIKVKFPSGTTGDVRHIVSELNQDQVQTLVDYTYKKILEICQMPDRYMSTGGNTGASMEIGQGWITAENWAKSYGNIFDRSEKRFLDVALYILNTLEESVYKLSELDVSEIEIKFTRNKLAHIMAKAQSAIYMKEIGVHPRIIFERIGLFDDPENAYAESLPYIEKMWFKDNDIKQGENLETNTQNNEGENPTKNTGEN